MFLVYLPVWCNVIPEACQLAPGYACICTVRRILAELGTPLVCTVSNVLYYMYCIFFVTNTKEVLVFISVQNVVFICECVAYDF